MMERLLRCRQLFALRQRPRRTCPAPARVYAGCAVESVPADPGAQGVIRPADRSDRLDQTERDESRGRSRDTAVWNDQSQPSVDRELGIHCIEVDDALRGKIGPA